jgi:glycosyltransferase involved in cell wall biosynthesis
MVDTRYNFQRLSALLDKDCVKIMHIDTAHMLFHNAAEANRLLALQQRRGVTLRPIRFETPNLAIEHADCATACGNEFTIGTFRYAQKPIYRLPVPAGRPCPWPTAKDFEACRKSFFWFASHGMVHKGLDLVLEAFAEMPDCHLTICGPVEKEPEFVNVYRKELYHTPNVHLHGWLDIDSSQFTDVANQCIAHVYSTCSEGGGACVLETMHAGLIPVASYEASVDMHDFGVLLKSSSVKDIQEGVRTITTMPASELERRARRAWEYARENHTREKFAQAYRQTIRSILGSRGCAFGSTETRSPA